MNTVYYFKFLTNQNTRVVTQLFHKSDNILNDLSLKVKIPDLRSEISLLLADQGCIYDHKQTKRFSWKDNEKKNASHRNAKFNNAVLTCALRQVHTNDVEPAKTRTPSALLPFFDSIFLFSRIKTNRHPATYFAEAGAI